MMCVYLCVCVCVCVCDSVCEGMYMCVYHDMMCMYILLTYNDVRVYMQYKKRPTCTLEVSWIVSHFQHS
jgi:hypothetical protein